MGTYIKDGGVQRLVQYAFIKDSNVWQRCKRIWVKDGGVWRKAYEIEAAPAAQTYTTVGTTAWTKPSGYFDYMTVQIWGGGAGGGGGSNNTPAGGGGGGAYIQYNVAYADVPSSGSVVVGSGGGGSPGTNTAGGAGSESSFLGARAGGGSGGGIAPGGAGGSILAAPSVTYSGYITVEPTLAVVVVDLVKLLDPLVV
jgi:hypothetical protein